MLTMPDAVWKCYRCELVFRSEASARTHEQISGHSVSTTRAVEA